MHNVTRIMSCVTQVINKHFPDNASIADWGPPFALGRKVSPCRAHIVELAPVRSTRQPGCVPRTPGPPHPLLRNPNLIHLLHQQHANRVPNRHVCPRRANRCLCEFRRQQRTRRLATQPRPPSPPLERTSDVGYCVGWCCAKRSSLSMCISVVFPALSRPRNKILAFLL